jgi:hypothetical protein
MADSKYIVVEKGFSGERVVYGPTSDKSSADKVANEHAARRVIERKEKHG